MSKLEKLVIAALTVMLFVSGYILFDRSNDSPPGIIDSSETSQTSEEGAANKIDDDEFVDDQPSETQAAPDSVENNTDLDIGEEN